ncbi:hypothetical protein H6P81_002020 [Aristolochia fimbriata]|uniref:Uncharacterized protein n=1 Tax=Aristolochia fimbriata TaxID=158543 RepID=A0AAV7FBT0_ARIFI|nr:hypothetical protein H6P81_002020 [Aristolochia fimbriata]
MIVTLDETEPYDERRPRGGPMIGSKTENGGKIVEHISTFPVSLATSASHPCLMSLDRLDLAWFSWPPLVDS